MKAFVDLKDYEKSIYRFFGTFPILLLIVACVLAYAYGIITTNFGIGNMADPIGSEGLSQAFFRGVLITVASFYIARMAAVNGLKKSESLLTRDEVGVIVPCMSHKTMFDMHIGHIVIQPNRLYFEPSRPFAGDLTFDFEDYSGFKFELGQPKASIGMYLLTMEQHMIEVKDQKGQLVGRFIIPEPKEHLDLLNSLL